MNQKPCHSVNPDSAPWHTKPNRLPQPSAVQIASHLGELIQVRLGPTGPVALITLPCPGLVSRIGYAPARGPIMVTDPVSAKARAAGRIALAETGAVGWGGQLSIERPAAPGLGLGSSTAETLSVVRAIARAFGRHLDPEREAAICLAAEAAVDPLMWEAAVLFASREGRVIERLAPISPMRVVRGVGGPPSPTDPKDDKFPDVTDVFAEIVASIRTGHASRVAQAATCSAEARTMHAIRIRSGSHSRPSLIAIVRSGLRPRTTARRSHFCFHRTAPLSRVRN